MSIDLRLLIELTVLQQQSVSFNDDGLLLRRVEQTYHLQHNTVNATSVRQANNMHSIMHTSTYLITLASVYMWWDKTLGAYTQTQLRSLDQIYMFFNPFQEDLQIIIIIIIIIIIKNECHSNIIVDRLQGYSRSKKLRESESESRSSKVVWQARCQL